MGESHLSAGMPGVEKPSGAAQFMAKLFAPAAHGAVFSAPVAVEDHLVITACEVVAGGGFGEGGAVEDGEGGESSRKARAGGGGGGGWAAGRPVAAIVVSADGVRIRPIIDVTKIGVALLTGAAAMLVAWGRIRAQSRGK